MKAPPCFEQTRPAREHAAAMSEGTLTLQVCASCGAPQYPYRELCSECLADALQWRTVDNRGTAIAAVRVHASMHAFFRDNAPWCICSVKLDAGPRVIAHAADQGIGAGSRVTVVDESVAPSCSVLVARVAQV